MTQDLSPDYLSHDAVYQRLKADGGAGWGCDADVEAMLGQVVPWLPPAATHADLLELGCGAGNLSLLLAAQGYKVTGVDIAPTAIEWALERAGSAAVEVDFCLGDVVTLSTFPDAAFDAVVDGHCLHCIVSRDRALCLEAVRRVLRPDGLFVVATMCGPVLDERLRRHFDPRTRTIVMDGRPTRHIGLPEDITGEVAEAGFEVLSVRVVPRGSPSEQDDIFLLARKR